ncbi:MAG TPA: 2-oxoglutarate:ferredoxin oxidoreductase [Arcobacter sp.]|nr:2-oxoglutarate:ferredoxin oxidoreductase [Arcobacter sp.]
MTQKVTVGPAGYMPESAPSMGVELSKEGEALLYGNSVPEEEAMRDAARALLTEDNPTIFPGPQVLWDWKDDVAAKASAILDLAAEIPNCKIIPMPDYRPKYPKIDVKAEINPNHPNLTILDNKIKACIFVGVHCHYANLSLRMIRAGAECYTIALCAYMGHEEAMVSIRDVHASTVEKFKEIVIEERNKLGIEWTATMPPRNPSLPKEEFASLSPADYGEYRSLIMSRKGEHVADVE